MRPHAPSSKARRAAATAASTSAPVPRAMLANTWPSLGLIMSSVRPSEAGCHLPPTRLLYAVTDCSAARLAVVTLMNSILLSLLQRHQRQFHAPILRAPGFGIVARHRMVLAAADRDDALLLDAFADQILGNRIGAALRKRLVVIGLADIVGVAGNFDYGLVVPLQNQRHAVQNLEERGVEVCAAGLEGDVARHVENEVVPLPGHRHAGSFHLLAQVGLLLVHVRAHRTAGKRTHTRPDQRPLPAILRIPAADRADDRAGAGADGRTLGRRAVLFFPSERVEGLARAQGEQTGGYRDQKFAHSRLLAGSCFGRGVGNTGSA